MIQFKSFSLELFDFEKCGKRPSFFADVYLHIVFIQCILDGYEEDHCQRQQDLKDKEPQNEVSLSSRLYFTICMLLSPMIYEIFTKLH